MIATTKYVNYSKSALAGCVACFTKTKDPIRPPKPKPEIVCPPYTRKNGTSKCGKDCCPNKCRFN